MSSSFSSSGYSVMFGVVDVEVDASVDVVVEEVDVILVEVVVEGSVNLVGSYQT